MKKRFHYRSLVSFLLFFSIVLLLITGTVIFISPPGRVAHWQHWTLLGFDKDQWQAQHTIFSYLFIIISVFHIFLLNWRIFWSYVKLKTRDGFRKKREFFVATALILMVFLGTSFEMPPFSSFTELGETIKHSWEEEQSKAPMPHTEDFTLNEISTNYLDIDVEEVVKKLEAKGILIREESQTLKEIAVENGISPADIYSILVPGSQQKSGGGEYSRGGSGRQNSSGRGYGRMTVEDIADDLNVDADEIIKRLKKNNIEVRPGQTIRDIAEEYDLHPSEIAGMTRGE